MQRLVSCSLPGKQTDTFGCKDRSVSGFVSGPADTRPVCSAKTRVTLAAKSCREEAAADRERAEEVGMFTGETTAYKILYQNRKKQRQPIVGRVGGSCKRTRVWFIATQILFKGCFMMFLHKRDQNQQNKKKQKTQFWLFSQTQFLYKVIFSFSPQNHFCWGITETCRHPEPPRPHLSSKAFQLIQVFCDWGLRIAGGVLCRSFQLLTSQYCNRSRDFTRDWRLTRHVTALPRCTITYAPSQSLHVFGGLR